MSELYRQGGSARLHPGFQAVYARAGDGPSAAACPRGGSAREGAEARMEQIDDAWEEAGFV
eukprot:2367271-Pyramimonas_sp.AAC.1